MVHGNDSALGAVQMPYADEIVMGYALVEESSEWLDETYADWRGAGDDPDTRMLPPTVLPSGTADDVGDMCAVADECIRVAMEDRETVRTGACLDSALLRSCLLDDDVYAPGAIDSPAVSDGFSSADDSAEEFAALFAERVSDVETPPPATLPMLPAAIAVPPAIPRHVTAEPRRRSRRTPARRPSRYSKVGGRRESHARSSGGSRALRAKKAGVSKSSFDEARSLAEMKQIVKQYGPTSTEARRHQHNVLERKRRCDLKSSYRGLRELVPSVAQSDRVPTGQILLAAIGYIRELQREDKEIQAALGAHRDENKRLKQLVCSMP